MDETNATDLDQSAKTQCFAENEHSEDEMESLMILDADDEVHEVAGNSNNEIKNTKKKPSKFLDDSDDEVKEQTENAADINRSPSTVAKKKFSNLIDSESELEDDNSCTENTEKSKGTDILAELNLDSDSESNKSFTKNKAQESESEPKSTLPNKKKISALIDSDSEDADREKSPVKIQASKKSRDSKKLSKNRSKQKKEKKSKNSGNDILSGLNLDLGSSGSDSTSSDSDSSHSSDSQHSGDEFIRKSAGSNVLVEEKKQRMSAKEAMEQMKVIQSESQRMAREAEVDIPYHKPKQYSLKEFLSRKTVNKPIVRPINRTRTTAASIKMSSEELEAYAKLLEDRRKEAEEFFKNDSEPEENENQVETVTENNETNSDELKTKNSENNSTNELCEKTTADLLKEMDDALAETDKVSNELVTLINNENESNEVEDQDVQTNFIEENIEQQKDFDAKKVIEENENQSTIEPEKINDNTVNEVEAKELETEGTDVEMENEHEPTVETRTILEKEAIPSDTDAQSELEKPISVKNKKLLSLLGNLPPIKPIRYDPNELIDLETGEVVKKPPTGPELLMERYIKNACKKKTAVTKDVDMEVVSLENGLHVEHILVKADDSNPIVKDPKPGAAYFKLKEQLEKKIIENRLKKVLQNNEYVKKLEEEQQLYSDDEIEEVESEKEDEPVLDGGDKPIETEQILEHEQHVEDQNELETVEDSDSSSDSSSDEEDATIENTKPRKSRIIAAFVDSDDEAVTEKLAEEAMSVDGTENHSNNTSLLNNSDNFDDVFKIPCMLRKSMETKTVSNVSDLNCEVDGESMNTMELLWDDGNEKPSEEDELSQLCSGIFPTIPDSTKTGQPSTNSEIINELCNTQATQSLNEDELSELCSGKFITQPSTSKSLGFYQPTQDTLMNSENELPVIKDAEESQNIVKSTLPSKRPVFFSSEEENEQDDTEAANEKKIKKLRKKRRRKVLEISDDESSLSENEPEEEIIGEEEEEPETFIDYDSEENEVEVQLTKKETAAVANNFLENEAELSGSEYGSGDENEQDLDRFEQELGDEDQFDQDQLQSELGKIHMRRLLDQDTREVKILQEMFFEDEEKDGVGRTRKFMWKNLDNNIDLLAGTPEDDNDAMLRESDDENEEQWRKMRHEREVLLAKSKEEKENNLEDTESSLSFSGKETSAESSSTKRKILIVKKQSVFDETQKKNLTDSPFLISFDKVHKESRASFLIRDDETLNKLATLVKEKDVDVLNAGSGKGRNFVFAAVTPPPAQLKKRPSDIRTDEDNQSKRQKMDKSNQDKYKKRLLDSLL